MFDDNWETINGPVAYRIEVLNATNQANLLEGMVALLLAHRGPAHNGVAAMPDETSLKQLHRTGTMLLLHSAGEYRNLEVHVGDAEGNVRLEPPAWQLVPGLMQQFFRQMSSLWVTGDALDVAAYALWNINWIHPFRNGNGRTARAFCYACLSLKIGAILPGTTTVIDQIMAHRDSYEEALQSADQGFKAERVPNLDPMKQFLHDMLQIQIASIPTEAAAAPSS